MPKQTSIEWLVSKIESNINPSLTQKELIERINQAQQMHKEEIMDAYNVGNPYKTAEQYYNEKYG